MVVVANCRKCGGFRKLWMPPTVLLLLMFISLEALFQESHHLALVLSNWQLSLLDQYASSASHSC